MGWKVYSMIMTVVALLGAVGGILINLPQMQIVGYIIVAFSVGLGAAAAYLQGQGVIERPSRK